MRQFKSGDIVKIKTWEELTNEFSLDEKGDINISYPLSFLKKMRYLCDEIMVVKNVHPDGTFQEESEGWWISPEMVHLVDKEQEFKGNSENEVKYMTVIMPL